MATEQPEPADHVVLYDGNCGFCKWMMAGVLAWDRDARVRPLALQTEEAEALLADVPIDVRMASWHLILPNGERLSAGAAVAPLMRALPAGSVPAAVVGHLPGPVDHGYRWVASHRMQISRYVPSRWKRHASEVVTRVEAERAPRA